jgi:tRNA-specific 2-thiouridylase
MRILAAVSGGVDSAVAAARLKADGADVVAVHLRTGAEADGAATGGARSCCGAEDARDARGVAAALDLPFYVVDVAPAFAGVIDEFAREYAAGRTPIPCVRCNTDVKFGRLLEIARGLGAERVATGHYARTARDPGGRWRLLRAEDERKDQTYMLHQLDQDQLAAACFPLGATRKEDVRRQARALGLDVADKPDSQELCFVPPGGPRPYLRARDPAGSVPGPFVDEAGREVGRHDGALGFTLGQRRGLPALGEARYVTRVDPGAGRVEIGPRSALLRRAARVDRVNWIDRPPPPAGTRLDVGARHRHAAALRPAALEVLGPGGVRVTWPEPVFALTPGQALVAYDGASVLCGGTIAEVETEENAT